MGFCKWPQPGPFPCIGADYRGRLVFAVMGKEVYGSGPADLSPKETGRESWNTEQDRDEGQAPHTSARERQKTHGAEVEEVWVDLFLCGSGLGSVTNLV